MAAPQLCAAPDCDKLARQNRFNACSMHEARMRRGGSFEPRQPRKTISELLGGREHIGWWTILGEGEPYHRPTTDGKPHPDGVIRTARCRCDCGTERDLAIHTLKQRNSRHCGCKMAIINPAIHGTHLMSATPEYKCWAKLKARCLNPNDSSFADYGGRGILVCDRWLTGFEAFFEDMGYKPSPLHSIDRIDVDGNYEPGNCRWATPREQAQNQRTTHYVMLHGEQMALREACRRIGAPYKSVHKRIMAGATFERAVHSYQTSLSANHGRNRVTYRP